MRLFDWLRAKLLNDDLDRPIASWPYIEREPAWMRAWYLLNIRRNLGRVPTDTLRVISDKVAETLSNIEPFPPKSNDELFLEAYAKKPLVRIETDWELAKGKQIARRVIESHAD